MTTLFVPLMLARLFGAIFAGASLITPFFLGAAAGAIASGRVPATGRGELFGSWLQPTSMFIGAIAVGTCSRPTRSDLATAT